MSVSPPFPAPAKMDVGIGLVRQAWRDACLAGGRAPTRPTAVEPLKSHRPGRKSGAYRLQGVGEGSGAVVAKRCASSTAAVERRVYELLLPRIGVPALRYYGFVEEPDGAFSWLFLEDAGEVKPIETDRALAAQWLARLHAGAANLVGEVPLPDGGSDRYLGHLRAGRELIGGALPQIADQNERVSLEALRRALDETEGRWDSIGSACEVAPRTLVHGDFARKNLRVRSTASGARELLALDWETAGWGPPAADLPYSPTRNRGKRRPREVTSDRPRSWDGTVSLGEYAAQIGSWWAGSRRRDLERLARVGTVFRSLAGVRWAAEQVQGGGATRGVQRLCWYAQLLPRAVAALDD